MTTALLILIGMMGLHAIRAALIYRTERAQFQATALRIRSPLQRQAWVRTSQGGLPAAASFSLAAEGYHDRVSRNGRGNSHREPAGHFTPNQFEEDHDLAARECAAPSSANQI